MRTLSTPLLPDGTPLQNRLLAALPAGDYARLQGAPADEHRGDRPPASRTRHAGP